ncbi:hypothetical protein [Gordonia caeni]|uniref:Uncharacterized protein n=1 Tax=Gordonia caeni TaxID=1007097 RepID=A0ABP7PBT8_9ACTN
MSFLPTVSPRSLADWIGELVTDAARPLAHAVARDLADRMTITVQIRFDKEQP